MSARLPDRPDSAAPEKPAARWSQGRRLEFLDFRLRWEGRINRSDLTIFFGISVPQASLDITKYLELAPGNAIYDRRSKVYLATDRFTPLFPSNEPSRYLNELLAREMGVLPTELSFLGWTPPTAAVVAPSRRLDAGVVIAVLAAIRLKVCLRVAYQSMSSAEAQHRIIAPHGVAFDGFRWHVRAFCHTRTDFRDFVLARMLEVELVEESGSDGVADEAWHRQVPLVIAPNPKLSKAHRRVIELDYGMDEGEIALPCRQALLFYSLRRLGLLDPKASDPRVQHIVLKNRSAVMQCLPAVPMVDQPR